MFVKDVLVLHTHRVLKFITCTNEKRRNQGKMEEPCSISAEALCNFLKLLIAAKSSLSDVVEFLDQSLKTSPCTKTS